MNNIFKLLIGLFIAVVSCTELPEYNTRPTSLSDVVSKGKPAKHIFERQIDGYGWKLTSIHMIVYGQVCSDEYYEFYGSGVNGFFFDKGRITCFYYSLGNNYSWASDIAYDETNGIVTVHWSEDKIYDYIRVISVRDNVLTTVEHVNSVFPNVLGSGSFALKTYSRMSPEELEQTRKQHESQ